MAERERDRGNRKQPESRNRQREKYSIEERSTYNERLCHDILHLSTIPTAFAWLRKSFEDNEYSSEELRNEIRESSCRIPQSYILLSSRERWLGTILEYD